MVIVDRTGEKAIIIDALPEPSLLHVGERLAPAADDWVVANLFHPDAVAGVVSRARDAGATTFIDLELPELERAGFRRAMDSISAADVICTNAQFLAWWHPHERAGHIATAAACARMLADGRRTGIVTLGAGGAVVADGGRIFHVATPSVSAVNTTGAGDTFAAGFVKAQTRRRSCRGLSAGSRCGGEPVRCGPAYPLGRRDGIGADTVRSRYRRGGSAVTSLATRINAVLAAACLGDALGAATEGMERNEIVAVFGGAVNGLRPAPERAPFAKGMTPGRLTDDATQMLAMADVLIRTGGKPLLKDAEAGLLAWADDEDVFRRFAGPTTRVAIERIRAGGGNATAPEAYSCSYGASNGAAMRAPAAGAAHAGNVGEAARVSAVLSEPTHDTQVAFAGAGAVAAAVAAGLATSRKGDIASAALEGARRGEAEGREHGRVVGGASVLRRLEVALDIAGRYRGDPAAAMAALEAEVGNGVAMAEAVPSAIALAVAADGDPLAAILAAVNGGNDSDTIAMIAGAVAAAWTDAPWIPVDLLAEVERVNHINLAETSRALAALTEARGEIA